MPEQSQIIKIGKNHCYRKVKYRYQNFDEKNKNWKGGCQKFGGKTRQIWKKLGGCPKFRGKNRQNWKKIGWVLKV